MRLLRGITLLDALLLLVALTATWQKMSWEAAGRVTLVDLLQVAFVGLFAIDRLVRRDARLHPAARRRSTSAPSSVPGTPSSARARRAVPGPAAAAPALRQVFAPTWWW